ncbi:RNA-guided endonuclease TnpB family protein [Thermosulfurimonas sp. F29]|uniref:RNA-guided endonuclease InsQ/TnpB family protein n=1 Tax=Thermosulfurimonas sp. F29 TaxID=2867247 RepID=UPI001C82BCA9|nr:RNA-guided endonuclease TnpB family protein [Thermosulfurimonas sp. F29]MBX6424146.1 transposase [Thermosulfurimonas sp. F29]
MTKSEKIKQALKQTKEKRKFQIPKVFQLKLQNISKSDLRTLERLFLEAKWFYNYVIADIENRLNNKSEKLKEVEIKTPNGFEKRKLKTLGSQIKQGIIERVRNNLNALEKVKEKGLKVGKLNFKSDFRSIPLKQYGITYKIDFKRNRVKVQGIKKKFRVLGLHQIPENAEIANAYLIKKPSGYYLYVVCYLWKEEVLKEIKKEQFSIPVGIDLGIKDQLILTTGEKIRWYIPETERLKRLQKILARKKKGSKNYLKVKRLIQKEWEHIRNKRRDIQSKVISYLKRFPLIAVQNDDVKSWHAGMFGGQVQNTGVGGITARLRCLATLIPVEFVDRYEPTTQRCSRCGFKQRLDLSQRVFECPKCGLKIDRDLNSAWNILELGLKKLAQRDKALADRLKSALPVDRGEVKPGEREASAPCFAHGVSSLVETGSPSL